MKIPCPHCKSSSTIFISQNDTSGGPELTFQCGNPACKSQFSGILSLTRGVAPGVKTFSADKSNLSQQLKTDC